MIWWLLFSTALFTSTAAIGFHLPAQKLDEQITRIEFNQPLVYQLTDKRISVNEIDTDPELHHSWQTSEHTFPSFQLNDQALWMTAAVMNATKDPMTVIVDLASPSADEVNMYVIDDSNNRMVQSITTGTNFNFDQRGLPYRSFAMEVTLQPNQVVNLYLRVVDSGSIFSNWHVWQKEAFVQHKLIEANIDGLFAGALIIFMLLNLTAFVGLKERLYAYFSGFLISYLLMISILNGSAFQQLWPNSPAVNQSSVYIASGLVLLFVSLFSQMVHKNDKSSFIQSLQYLNILLSALVIFLPLFIAQIYHLNVLLLATLTVITIGSSCAYWRLIKKKEHAILYAMIWTIFLFGGSLLILNRYGIISAFSFSYNQASTSVVLTAMILSFSLVKRIRLEKSAKEQAKSQAAETLQQYFDIYQNAVEGLFTLSVKGELLSANPQLVEALGFKTFAQLRNYIRKNGAQTIIGDMEQAKLLLAEVQEKGQVSSKEVQGIKQNGSHIWGLMTMRCTEAEGDNQETFIHGAVVDITEKHQAYQKLAYMATHDGLTGVLNRSEFEKKLHNALSELKQTGITSTMLYLDLEHLKLINDTCGHVAGDSLLRQISDELQAVLNDQGSLARLGGDKFAILLPGINGNEAFVLAYRIIEATKEFKFQWEKRIFSVGINIGMKELAKEDNSLTRIFTHADAACYVAKEKGRNRIHIYSPEDQDIKQQQSENQWITTLNDALDNDQFVLYQQMIKPIEKSEERLSYEILLRMKDEQQNIIPPETFIPAAERYNLMTAIDTWVIQAYFRWLSKNPEHLQNLGMCSINLSGNSIADQHFKTTVMDLFVEYLIPHDKICFEITESVAVINLNATLDFIAMFKNLGCKFSLDDFGTGFSSYGYLKNLPVDYVKIDGSFVKDVLIDTIDRAMVNSINEVAKAMGMQTVAELVESEAILEQLQLMEVDYAQGFCIHRPAPLAQLVID